MKSQILMAMGVAFCIVACSKSDLSPTATTTTNQSAVASQPQGQTSSQSNGGQQGTGTNTASSGTTATMTSTGSVDISVLKSKFKGNVTVTVDGNYLVIKSTDIPDHKSPYFKGTQWESTLYEAYNGTGTFSANPSVIQQQSLTFRIPIHPQEASTKASTPLGPMGVSLNGVPFFNQYAAGRTALTTEKVSFDQYGGHPQQQGQYHYHVEPTSLTARNGSDAFLGLLLDGFPVYGPKENGKLISNSDLDAYHGHTSKTTDFPNGIYHYHITSTDPYINGSGFFGTAGTVSQ